MADWDAEAGAEALAYHLAQARTNLPADGGDAAAGPLQRAGRSARSRLLGGQARVNDELLAAVELLVDAERHHRAVDAGVAERLAGLEHHVTLLAQAVDATGGRLQELQQRTEHLEHRTTQLEQALQAARDELVGLQAHGRTLQTRLDTTLAAANDAIGAERAPAQLRRLAVGVDEASDEFYQAFEEAFRGSQAVVKGRLQQYVDDLRRAGGPVLDIGCGRGEWLAVLGEHDIEARGVDLNTDFVAEAVSNGLDVVHGDGLEHLTAVAPGSLGAVTAFHVAEHLAFESLVRLVGQALVALRPGGLLLLETPNPSNLVVGANTFYVDPTHLKPLQPLLLEFLCRYRGFAEVEVRYVQPSDLDGVDLAAGRALPPAQRAAFDRLQWALFSPLDYAVLARTARAPADAQNRAVYSAEP